MCSSGSRRPRTLRTFHRYTLSQGARVFFRRCAALYDVAKRRNRHIGPVYRMVQQGTVRQIISGRPIVFSYGAGLDSAYSLVMLFTSDHPYWSSLRERLALIIHADLGAEFEETTDHLYSVMIPFLRERGWEMTIIKPRVTARDGKVYEDIYGYYMAQGAVPTRAKRSCTPRFKIGPLLAASKDLLGTDDYETIINYDASETHRTERLKEVPESERERIRGRLHHPPMQMGKYRLDMFEELQAIGMQPPRKSACFFCIFQKVAEVEWMALKKPHFMAKTIALEENMQRARRYSRRAQGKGDITILSKPMRYYQERALARRAAQDVQGRLFALPDVPPDLLKPKKKSMRHQQGTVAQQTMLVV